MTRAQKIRQRRRIRIFRRVCGALAMIMFFALLGVVGGIEQDTIPLGRGFLTSIGIEAAMIAFAYLAGAFMPARPARKEARHG
ncbi:MAG: hypothetical protein MJ074_05920 [Oscillospiraceae bacterium]|nr:hypothetical protein [Oscillospiraceae bacterium]